MSKLEKLTPNSRNTEVDAVSIRIIRKFDEQDWSSDTHLTGIFGKLKPESVKLTTAINRSKMASNLEEKDEIRDTKVQAINYLINGFVHHPDPTIKEAAVKVDDVYEKYGLSITRQNYGAETSLVNSLLIDFAKPDLQPSIEALPGMGQLITELTNAQAEFEVARVKYEDVIGEELKEINATKLKKTVTDIINEDLVEYLRVMVKVDETKYSNLYSTIAKIIFDNNEMVKKRRKPTEASVEEV